MQSLAATTNRFICISYSQLHFAGPFVPGTIGCLPQQSKQALLIMIPLAGALAYPSNIHEGDRLQHQAPAERADEPGGRL